MRLEILASAALVPDVVIWIPEWGRRFKSFIFTVAGPPEYILDQIPFDPNMHPNGP